MEKVYNYHHGRNESHLARNEKRFAERAIFGSVGVDINENLESFKSLAEKEKAVTEAA